MRGWALCAMVIAALAPGPAGARADGLSENTAPSIVDLYRELQVAQPNGFPAYEIIASPQGFRATEGLREGARVGLEADLPGLYLAITERGASDSADGLVTQMAVWLDPDGAPLAGLTEFAMREGAPFGGRLRFYSRASGRWNLVTDKVWPVGLDLALCGRAGPEVTEETAAWDGLGPLVALLPRQGTDVAAWCVGPNLTGGAGASIVWSGARGVFERGAPLSGPPPWRCSSCGRGN